MDDPLLVRVLDGMANRQEQFQPLAGCELVLVAILRDRLALDQLHYEKRPAAFGRASIDHSGDIRMIHQRQGLLFRLEAGDHLAGVHARLDDLERDFAADRLALLGHIDHPHAPFADFLQQFVRADLRAGLFQGG